MMPFWRKKKPEYPDFQEALPSDPKNMTLQYFKDYTEWNDFSFRIRQEDGEDNLDERSYDALVSKYCGSDKKRQCLAYGSTSSFHPETTSIKKVDDQDAKTVILVSTERHPGIVQYHEFEFHLRDGKWLLDEIYYLDEYDNNARMKLI